MKIIGISGSARKGNSQALVSAVLDGASSRGAEVELLRLADYTFSDCTGCEGCAKSGKCIVKDDMQMIYRKLDEADGLVLGSPTYFYNMNGITKSFVDRLYAYEMFNREDRGVWLSVNEVLGTKYCVTVAVSEQEKIEDMGFASEAMSKALGAVGWRSVADIKALHLFKRDEYKSETDIIAECEKAGDRLVRTIELAQRVGGLER